MANRVVDRLVTMLSDAQQEMELEGYTFEELVVLRTLCEIRDKALPQGVTLEHDTLEG